MSYESVPEELKALTNWVGWKLELRDGKLTKIPYSSTHDLASSTDPKTWRAFTDVCGIPPSKEKGIGFVFNGNGIVGIDIDHCLVDNEIVNKEFENIVKTLNSYTEVSPSGTGLHVFIRCTEPPYSTGKKKGDIEIYSKERYFTVTGEVWLNQPINTVSIDIVRALLDPFVNPLRPTQEKYVPTTTSVNLSDDDIIRIASGASNSTKFERLMDGHIGDYANDRSVADMALASILAFYTTDGNQIERIMRMSGLVREKWDKHQKYLREYTIAKAIQMCNHHFEPKYEMGDLAQGKESTDAIMGKKSTSVHKMDDLIFGNEEIDISPLDKDHIVKQWYDICSTTQDSYPEYHFASILIIVGHLFPSLMTPQYAPSGVGNNMWCIILGNSGCGKSMACGAANNILNNEVISKYSSRISSKITPEAFVLAFSKTNRQFHYSNEAAGVLKFMKRDYASELTDDITNAYDGEKISKTTLKNGVITCNNPKYSALWNTTLDAWSKYATIDQFMSGMFFRPFFIISTRYKDLKPDESVSPEMKKMYDEFINNFIDLLHLVHGASDKDGNIPLIKTIKFAENQIINDWKYNLRTKSQSTKYSEMEKSAIQRIFDQCRKLAMNLTIASPEFKKFMKSRPERIGNIPEFEIENVIIPDKYARLACDICEKSFWKNSVKAQRLTYCSDGTYTKIIKALEGGGEKSKTELGDIAGVHGQRLTDILSDLPVASEIKKVEGSCKPVIFYHLI